MLHYLGFELDDDLLSYKMAITDTDGSGRIEKARACTADSARARRMHPSSCACDCRASLSR